LEHKSAPETLFQVKRNVSEATHVEEGFVLDFADAWVVQILYVDEATGFREVISSCLS